MVSYKQSKLVEDKLLSDAPDSNLRKLESCKRPKLPTPAKRHATKPLRSRICSNAKDAFVTTTDNRPPLSLHSETEMHHPYGVPTQPNGLESSGERGAG